MNSNLGTLPILKQHSKLLEESLREIPHGTFLSFDELNERAKIDVTKYRSVMESVKKTLLRDHNRLLISIRGQGYQVAKPEEYATVVDHGIKSIKRKVGGCRKVIEKIEWSKLDQSQTLNAVEAAGKVSILNVVLKTATLKKLSQNVNWGKLPSEESVVAFLLDRTKYTKK